MPNLSFSTKLPTNDLLLAGCRYIAATLLNSFDRLSFCPPPV